MNQRMTVSNSHKYTDKIYVLHTLYLWDTIYVFHVLDAKNVILLAWQGEVVREEWLLKLADHVQKSPQNALFLHGMRNVFPRKCQLFHSLKTAISNIIFEGFCPSWDKWNANQGVCLQCVYCGLWETALSNIGLGPQLYPSLNEGGSKSWFFSDCKESEVLEVGRAHAISRDMETSRNRKMFVIMYQSCANITLIYTILSEAYIYHCSVVQLNTWTSYLAKISTLYVKPNPTKVTASKDANSAFHGQES